MKCPIDSTELRMMDRQGIEIDYCPTCRGIWLDRGELDKLIERSAAAPAAAVVDPGRDRPRPSRDDDYPPRPYDDRPRDYDDDDRDNRRPRRRSFLDDIFDFD